MKYNRRKPAVGFAIRNDESNSNGIDAFKLKANNNKLKKGGNTPLKVDEATGQLIDSSIFDAPSPGLIYSNDSVTSSARKRQTKTTLPPEQEIDEEGDGDDADSATTPPPSDPGMLNIKESELNTIIESRIQDAIQPKIQGYIDQIDAITQDADIQRRDSNVVINNLNGTITDLNGEVDRLKRVFASTGTSIPTQSTDAGSYLNDPKRGLSLDSKRSNRYNVNFLQLPRSRELQHAAADYWNIVQNPAFTPTKTTQGVDGEAVQCRDPGKSLEYIRNNKDELRHDMEIYAKGNGLLLGDYVDQVAGYTQGTAASIPDAFLAYLSDEMRYAKSKKFIWHQFANFQLDIGQRPGATVLVPLFQNLAEATSEADYILEEYNAINNISTDNQAMVMTTVPVTIKGYGLGLGTSIANRPVAIPEFILVTSLIELLNVLNQKLTHHYNGFEDLMIRNYYRWAVYNTANIRYNVNGQANADPTQLIAAADGTMSEAYLRTLFSAQTDRDDPSLTDGRRIAVLSTTSATQLFNSLETKMDAPSEMALRELTEVLNASYPGGQIDKVSGYMGNFGGYHCFENLSSSKGAAGAEGVYTGDAMTAGTGTATIGTATPADATMRDNYFFGPDTVARGTSLAMELRTDDANQFRTKNRFIWRSIEGFGPIAVSSLDAAGAATNQENSVLIGRTSDTIL